jgi:hypothetical protein
MAIQPEITAVEFINGLSGCPQMATRKKINYFGLSG